MEFIYKIKKTLEKQLRNITRNLIDNYAIRSYYNFSFCVGLSLKIVQRSTQPNVIPCAEGYY